MENNILIAEFLEFTYEKNIGWYDNAMLMTQCVYDAQDGNCFDELLFDKSWEWLKPVVDKIESICIKSTEMAAKLDGSSYLWYWDANEIGHSYDDPSRHIVSTSNRNYVYVCGSVDNVYQAVVEFIKFYNNQNK